MVSFRFAVGQRVRYRGTNQIGEIRSLMPIANQPHYEIDIAGESVMVAEATLELARDRFDQLAEWKKPTYAADFDLAFRATALTAALGRRGMSCLTNARLSPKPHQVFVAHRVLQDLYPRYILADEVGLGKTIEAGLVLKELKARGLAERILIITPASLCEQWRSELRTKFNEQFVITDGIRVRDSLKLRPDENPWARDTQIITSLQFARGQCSTVHRAPRRREETETTNRWIDEVAWDLVIFDEAHHLRRYLKSSPGTTEDRETTQSYRLAQALEDRARSLLLLTATPLQTSEYDAYSLIALTHPYLFRNFTDFQIHLRRVAHKNWQHIVAYDQLLARPPEQIQPNELVRQFQPLLQSALEYNTYRDVWNTLTAMHPPTQPIQPHSRLTLAQVQRYYDTLFKMPPTRWRHLPPPDADPLLQTLHARLPQPGSAQQLLQHEGFGQLLLALRDTLRDWIGRQHRLSRVMIRNRKREVLKGEIVDREAILLRVTLTDEELTLYHAVSDYIRTSYTRLLQEASGKRSAVGFILTTFRKLLVSSRSALAASLERRAARLSEALRTQKHSDDASLDDDEWEELNDLVEVREDADALFNLTGRMSPEEIRDEIRKLRAYVADARRIAGDSKAERLLDAIRKVLHDDPTEKVLIFTQFRETQRYLEDLLRRQGYETALFHGEQYGGSYDKRREFARFKQDPKVRIMIATDIGGEGLNLQFCRNLINYDLPWNPMKIEQRIGRIDRIGQQRNVRIFNFMLEGTLDGRIMEILQERVGIFEAVIGVLDPMLGEEIEHNIKDIMFASDEKAAERRLHELEKRLPQRLREAHEAEKKSADFVMDTRSFRQETVDRVLAEQLLVTPEDIEGIVRALLHRFQLPGQASRLTPLRDGVWSITLPGPIRNYAREHLSISLAEQYTGTFDVNIALADELIDFFAVGHPLVDVMLRFGTDRRRNGLQSKHAVRVLTDAELAGFEGAQFNFQIIAEGVRTYQRLVPIILDRQGHYDETRTRRMVRLHADETAEAHARHTISADELRALERQAYGTLQQIAATVFTEHEQLYRAEVAELRARQEQIFTFRQRRLEDEL